MGNGWRFGWADTEHWVGNPSRKELAVFHLTYDGLLIVIAVIGTICVVRSWRAYARASHVARVATSEGTSEPTTGPAPQVG
ncbi:MAG TPA: hypothetical protein VGQ20_00820 [Acidimicrobiales bacterium]|jgi:hypothetical protein|nr:hypothetical protein [Acidimicrobiales bacterium]